MNILEDLRTKRFGRHFCTKALACGGAISGLLQFLLIFQPEFEGSLKGAVPLIVIIVFCIIVGVLWAWPRPLEENYNTGNTKISIVKGDFFDEKGHIAIGTCDTFDTGPPPIISATSILGQTVSRLFGGDIHRLDALLAAQLQSHSPVSTIAKAGKKDKYEIGTTLVVRHDPRLIFFIAYSEMNERNEAITTIDGVWKSLLSLWDALSAHGNNASIAIPVIGGGPSRIAQILPAQDSIRLIILSFMFESRKRRIAEELRIVVRPDDYDKLDRLELRAFLASLKSS